MTEYSAARINMVDSQIHPMGVVNDDILEAFRTIRREDFVPCALRTVAYNDEDLALGNGRYLMEPVTQARLLQAATPIPFGNVLDIGCALGYSTAILSRLAQKVVAVEPDAGLLATAQQTWVKLGLANIIPHQGSFEGGCPKHGPYNLIVINGSLAVMPESILAQLAAHGIALCVIRKGEDRIGRATLFSKNADSLVSERVLFDASVPYLPGHEPVKQFVF